MNIASFVKTETLSEITRDIRQVFFASMFLASMLQGKIEWAISLGGLVLSIIFWVLSLLLSEK